MATKINDQLSQGMIMLVLLLSGAHSSLAQKPELVAQTGHFHTVRAVAISPNSKLLASAGADKTVILWDVATNRQLFSLNGHSGWVFSLAFSPDGQFLASGSADATVILWNISKGRKEYDISLQSNGVTSVAFSPDGTALAISSTNEAIHLWDMRTRKLSELRGHTGQVTQVAFSPDGKYLASSSMDQTVRLWNLAKLETEFSTTYKDKDSLSFSMNDFKNPVNFVGDMRHNGEPISHHLRSQFNINTLKLLKEYDGSIPLSQPLQNALVEELDKVIKGKSLFDEKRFTLDKLDEETKKLLAQNPQGDDLIRLNLLLLEEAYPLAIAGKENRDVLSLAYSPDGNFLAFASADNNISIWDLQTKALKTVIPPHGYQVAMPGGRFDHRRYHAIFRFGAGLYPSGSLTFTSNNELAFVDSFMLRLRNIETGEEKPAREILSGTGSYAVAINRERNLLAFNDGQGLKLISLVTQEIKEFKGGVMDVSAVMFSPKGRSIAAGVDRLPRLWGSDFEISEPSLASVMTSLVSATNVYVPSINRIAHIEPTNKEAEAHDIKLLKFLSSEEPLRLKGHTKTVNSIARSPDGTQLVSSSEDGTIIVWDVKKRVPKRTLPVQAERITFSPDGRLLATAGKADIKLWDVKMWESRSIPTTERDAEELLFSPNSKVLAANTGELGGTLVLWEVATGKHLYTFNHDATPENPKTDAPLTAVSPYAREILTSTLYGDIKAYKTASGPMAFSPDNSLVACQEINFATSTYRIKIWNVSTGKEVHTLPGHSQSIRSIAFSPNGKILLSGSWDGTIKLWNTDTGGELATLLPLENDEGTFPFLPGNWVVFTPEGRFDTNVNIDEVKNLNWIIPGDALHPLSLSVFMRDYYEPNLLPRILAGEKFRPVRDISALNWTQPRIEIKEVKPDGVDTVEVTLRVVNVVSEVQRDAQGRPLQSGVFDVRLFRDGQLISSSTDEAALAGYIKAASDLEQKAGHDQVELALWQKAHRVETNAEGHHTLTFHKIKLPHSSAAKEVEFSAYAFNNDRIKSDTARHPYKLPPSGQPRKGRAYVIAVGVNAYENSHFNLSFAANDALRMQTTVARRLKTTGEYEEVVPISLISDWKKMDDGQLKVTHAQATKDNVRTVLRLLTDKAGEVSPTRRSQIANADRLRPVGPDDLVLILFSSHGYVDGNGRFYLIPYDTGAGAAKEFTEAVRQHSISSDELSLWLRDMDAGQMALIVDACHSAAAVESSEFKPGPMGSRGLGQLSYDKGMRILTATQSDNVALEVCTIGGKAIRQGLLSYALTIDGLEKEQADFSPVDKDILMSEWLEFGTFRVPQLFQEAAADKTRDEGRGCDGRLRLVRKGVVDEAEDKTQQPALFDFTRRRNDTIISRRR